MRNFFATLAILPFFWSGIVNAQTGNTDIRHAAFFSDEYQNQLALNFANSLEIDIYVNGALDTTIVETHPNAGFIADIGWNATGDQLAVVVLSVTGAEDFWYVWDMNTRQRILEQELDFVQSLEWHPTDPNRLIVTTGVHVKDIHINSSTVREALRIFTNIFKITWSPTGNLLSILDDQGRIYLLSGVDLSIRA